jgi:hypothetical protein
MSKNLTRKGLALGAVVALGSSLFAGTPAFAAPGITIAPAAGTSYSFISGERFDLKVFGNTEFTFATTTDIQWDITNAAGESVTTTTNNAAAAATSDSASASTTTITKDGGTAGTAAGANRLGLAVAADKAVTLKVRAFVELNGTTGYQAGADLGSNEETVTFIKKADVVPTLAITAPVEGDTKVAATAKLNVNNEQLTPGDFALEFTKGDGTSLGSTQRIVFGAWSTTDLNFAAETGTVTALVKDSAVKVQAYYNASGAAYASTDKLGTAATASVVARKVALFTADVVRSATAKTISASNHVKRNSSFELKATATDSSTPAKAVAGSSVTVAVTTSATLSSTAGSVVSLTINGVTYTDNAKLPGAGSGATAIAKIATTTDSSGIAKIAVTTSGFAVGNNVVATFGTENFSSAVTAISVEPTYTGYITNALTGTSVVAAGTAAINVSVYDQFGGTPADEYDARAVWVSSNSRTTASTTASSKNVAIVGGKATLSVVDNGTGTGYNVYNVEFAKRVAGGGYTGNTAIDTDFEVRLVAAADLVAGKITSSGTLNATTKVYEVSGTTALNLEATGSSDFRTVSTDPTFTNSTNLTGVVSTVASATAAAVAIEGAKVTVSGTGLQFRTDALASGTGYVFGAGSIEAYTDASGNYSVDVASNKAGKQTITITSGSFSQTVTVTFAAAAATTGTSLVIDAPAYILPGRTVTVTATLTDKFGNPVAVSNGTHVDVAWAGPGLTVGTMVDAFDAAGQATFRVLLGANETGSGTVTVKYDQSADGDFTGTASGDLDLVKTATVQIGAAPVAGATAAVAGSTKRFFVSVDGNSSARNVVVKVAGRTFATLKGSSAKKTYTVRAPKGSHKVTVFVGGQLIATKTISVK